MDNDITEIYKTMIKKSGFPALINSNECVIYITEHSNCLNCPSEISCLKLLRLQLNSLIPLMYKPKDFTDYQSMTKRINELTNLILKAKTIEELDEIPEI